MVTRCVVMMALLAAACGRTGLSEDAGPLERGSVASVNQNITFFTLNLANGFYDKGTNPYGTPAARSLQTALVTAQNPDVVGFQEVDVGCARSGGGNTAAQVLGPLLGAGTLIFGEEQVLPGNCHVGNALWISNTLAVGENWVQQLDYGNADPIPRVAIRAHVVAAGGRKLEIATTHLSTDSDATRQMQLEEIVGVPPDVLLGDINMLGDTTATKAALGDVLFPAVRAGSIDQIWWDLRGTGTLIEAYAVGASDHHWAARAVATP